MDCYRLGSHVVPHILDRKRFDIDQLPFQQDAMRFSAFQDELPIWKVLLELERALSFRQSAENRILAVESAVSLLIAA